MKRKSQHFPEDKPVKVIEWTLSAPDRSSYRKQLAEKWLEEEPYTNYRYNVEVCQDRKRVYLVRPTRLNKGFDFQINVEGFTHRTKSARTTEAPSHDDVLEDIAQKLKENPDLRRDFFEAICLVYDCHEVDLALERHPNLTNIRSGMETDKLLRIIKWFFIEQDLTYWLWRGRDKFMAAIEHEFGLD